MSALLLLVVLAAVVAAFSFMQASQRNTQLTSLRADKERRERELEELQKQALATSKEMRLLKGEMTELRDELKGQKKKNWELKKGREAEQAVIAPPSLPPPAPEPSPLATYELESLRTQVGQLEQERDRVTAALRSAEAATARLEQSLAAERAQKKQATQADERDKKLLLDLRRKAEWHRRIYLVQRGELGKEADKLAHLRRRYLELCKEYVRHVQAPLPEDLQQLEREQAAWTSQQEETAANP